LRAQDQPFRTPPRSLYNPAALTVPTCNCPPRIDEAFTAVFYKLFCASGFCLRPA
jgi:hypothetical protein